MLVLTRKRQERIMIRQDIEVAVLAVKGNRVELGILAPSDVSIVRNEADRCDPCVEDSATKEQPPRTTTDSIAVTFKSFYS
jgi:carbon storage regulator